MPPSALQSHFARSAAEPPPIPPPRGQVAPPPPAIYGPRPLPLRPEAHIPLTPETGMTRAEIERRIEGGPEEELKSIKTKIRTALALIGESRITDTLRQTRERQNQIITLLAQIAG